MAIVSDMTIMVLQFSSAQNSFLMLEELPLFPTHFLSNWFYAILDKMSLNGATWTFRIHIADPNFLRIEAYLLPAGIHIYMVLYQAWCNSQRGKEIFKPTFYLDIYPGRSSFFTLVFLSFRVTWYRCTFYIAVLELLEFKLEPQHQKEQPYAHKQDPPPWLSCLFHG